MKTRLIFTLIFPLWGLGGLVFSYAQDIKSYSNYDFVAGQKIIFEDNFKGDKDGEFGSHWDIKNGQAVLNKMDSVLVMKITDGNYGTVLPLMKEKNYLPKEFTLEYDYYQTIGAYPLVVWFNNADDAECMVLRANRENAGISFFVGDEYRNLDSNTPDEIKAENFDNKWHHIAFIFKICQYFSFFSTGLP